MRLHLTRVSGMILHCRWAVPSMRIRFVTKAQIQVLQASRMEKHTMKDGTILLSGLSPLVVCRQWGTADCNKYFVLPLKYPDRYIMVATFLTMSSNITNELAVKIDSLSTARINCSLNEQVTSPQAVWISIGVWWTVGNDFIKERKRESDITHICKEHCLYTAALWCYPTIQRNRWFRKYLFFYKYRWNNKIHSHYQVDSG